jgi:predicted MPP superfamily phosphohydrolase
VDTHIVSRRLFLRTLLSGTAGAAGLAAAAGYARYVEPRSLRVDRVYVPLAGLSPRFEGLRIVQLSDFHLGPFVPVKHVRRAVRLANSLEPDLIVVTGDFVSVARRYVEPAVDVTGELSAPLGVFAVLGNHDFWVAPRMITSLLRQAGIIVLRNEAVSISRGGARLQLAGVDDIWARADDIGKALAGVEPDEPTILLCHNPDLAPEAPSRGVSLLLAGHTHGGQVRLPVFGPLVVPSKYGKLWAAGLHHVGPMLLYVNRGIGVIPPPVRFLCPPEVTLLELRCAPPRPIPA